MASTYSFLYKRERPTIHTVQNQALKYRIGGEYLLQVLFVFVAYVIAGKLGQAATNIRSSNLGPVWPASGIALAAILICGYRVWPGVLAGTIVVAFFGHVSHVTALGQAAGSTLAALTGAFSLHRIAKFDRTLSRLSDALSLIALGGFGDAMVSASIGVFALHAAHVHPYSGVGAAWLIYWLGDATGILLVTPLVLRFTDFLKLRDGNRLTELVTLLLLLVSTCLVIFGDLPSIPVKLHVLAFAVLPFVIWAAIRFGLGVTALSILVVAAIATVETAMGSGPFASNTTFVNAVLLDVFFAVLSITGLSLAAVIIEREQAEREREQVVSKQAAMEERLRAAGALRESEEKFRSVFRDAGVGMVIVSPEGRFLAANGTFCDCLGYTEEELLAKTVESVTFSEDWPAFAQKLREVLAQERSFQWFQKRCLHKSGRIVYTETNASVIRSREGNPQYLVGQVLDVTKRKEAEEALSGMTRKLVEAQEQDRARIARELHDDINQRLAMLTVDLERLQDDPSQLKTRIQELRKQTTEISSSVQSISHDLHSSRLEYLGVVAGIKSWCEEFGERQGMQIDCRQDVRSALSSEIGLGLFRILQEALHNAAKHTEVKYIEVQLLENSGEINLIVKDLGKGFDIESVRKGRGLGLTSMQERVRLLNGTIEIRSKLMAGTTIHVRVPLESEHDTQRKAV
jgi:PAS domain S-box-containing protein